MRGLIGAAELARMEPTARLINTSRWPSVEEQALMRVLKTKQIAGAAIDVFDVEPLPPDHPFRALGNGVLMQSTKFGHTGLTVSRMILGTGTNASIVAN